MDGGLSERDVARILRAKRSKGTATPYDPRLRRKSKLKMRYKHRIDDEILRTLEKLQLLQEIAAEMEQE